MNKANLSKLILLPLILVFSTFRPLASNQTIPDINSFIQTLNEHRDNPIKSIELLNSALDTAKNSVTLKELATTSFALGVYQYSLSNYRYAEPLLLISAQTFSSINDTLNQAWALQRLAITQRYWGHYREAQKTIQEAWTLFHSINNKIGQAYALMVEVYINNAWGHFDRIEAKCREALNMHKELEQSDGVAFCLLALGNFHLEYNRLDSAWNYYTKSLTIFQNLNQSYGTAITKRDMGRYWFKKGMKSNALSNYSQALDLHKSRLNKRGIAELEVLIGDLYLKTGNYGKAIEHFETGQKIAIEIELSEEVAKNHKLLAFAYEKVGQQTKAVQNLNLYIKLKDSLFNAEKHFQFLDLQTSYETEKKQQQIALQNARIEKNTAELSRKNIFILFLTTGVILLIALSFMVYQLYRTKKHDNRLLSNQKAEIEHKNRQITDSINYARRIQNAVLSSEEELRTIFPNSFILFMPKDIVSGDFFFFREFDNKVLIAAADCTGHGVPGAFMSMLGTTLLNEIIGIETPDNAASVLETMRIKAKSSLHQSSFNTETKDGMEMSLCLLNKSNGTLEFAGAGNPLYIIRENDLIEYKGTRCPIGVHVRELPFENHNIQLAPGDTIYLFSDGYADQIGGANGHKLKISKFKQLLIEHSNKPLKEQGDILESFINSYMNGYDQIDDILIIGLRI